jgi:GMP synthase (glutamine-hydrolysing)
MTMRCVALRHVAFEDLGLFEPVLKDRGCEVEYVCAGFDSLAEQDWVDDDLVVVLSGPIGAGDIDLYPWLGDEIAGIRRRLYSQRPLLGLCLFAQPMAAALNASVMPLPTQEIGWGTVSLTAAGGNSPLRQTAGLDLLHWHGDAFDLPQGAALLASTLMTPNQAFSVGPAALALQFHAEVNASKMEPGSIGHTTELRAACVDVCPLRVASARQCPAFQAWRSSRLLNEWLDTADSNTRSGQS